MTFEEIQDKIREKVEGTSSIHLESNHIEVYLNIHYKPLDIKVRVPYCEDIEVLVVTYIEQVLANTNNRRIYYEGCITALNSFDNHLFESLPQYAQDNITDKC